MLSTCLDLALVCHPVLAFITMSRPKRQLHDSRLQYFLASFIAVLALRYASTSYFSFPNEFITDVCQTHDLPNPIASLYPNNATGTLNGTVAVIPISLKLAREIIPPQYRILEHAYRQLLPDFPEDMYPAVLQALHDHEVQAFGYLIPDFSRTGIEFPFLDLLGDNITSFKWAPSMLMTAGHEIALKGAMDYGTNVFASTFDPPCDAYRSVPRSRDSSTTHFSAKSSEAGAASISTLFSSINQEIFPFEFFKNVTNQPTFADGKTCDNMIRLFDTNVTTSIEPVTGTVKAKIAPFTEEKEWASVYGLRMDTAFIENNYLPCENFRGYGTQ
ncbi:hypothetical protein FB567DRAFT_190305 [Paraphoma chrysanthemicola]|uniref:Uncharacterized protein n=1 Tax=Paraphoma chrysanthemicola TaxID=798071 RepID=A0A8K0QWL4_9PLEO|nr:hypothetical protein FB567DRAFT_190305 [Paraphoma chrysanthemicola]